MPPAIDLTGQQFGRLTVIAREEKARPRFGQYRWICRCSCGNKITVQSSSLQTGNGKSCGCLKKEIMSNTRSNEKHWNWNGGKKYETGGYVRVKFNHPNSDKRGYIGEHILVMSNKVGRPLEGKETVHHLNGVRDDNRIENLELWSRRHPPGARIEDKVKNAIDILRKYSPKCLSKEYQKKYYY